MESQNNAFEHFINDLLKTHERNDRLRNALKDSIGISNAVDRILFESQIAAFFIPNDTITKEYVNETVNKLIKLQGRIVMKYPNKQAEDDHMVVEMIKRKILEQDSLLSKYILLYLNNLYKEYGH